MEAALTILRFAVPVFFGLGTVVTILAVRRAPVGREDADGFRMIDSIETRAARSHEVESSVSSNGVSLA
jgi:hypothetical protein